MTPQYFQRVLLEQLQGKFHTVVDRDVVGRIYPTDPRPSSEAMLLALDDALTHNRPLPPVGKSSLEYFTEACQKDNLEVSVHEPSGHYVVAHKRPWHFCYYCGSEAHDDTPCPHRKEDAERFARAGQALYPKLTK